MILSNQSEDERALAALNLLDVLREQATPVAIYNLDLRFVFANPAYLAVTGVEFDDIVGRDVFEVFSDKPERVERVREKLLEAANGEASRTRAQEYAIRDADGVRRIHYWRTLQEPLRDADGAIRFIMQTAENVTERVRLRRERELVAEEMAHRTKNVLAVVEAMTRLASRDAEQTKADFAEDLSRRLRAMGRNHTRLYARGFCGLSLRTLLLDELEGIASTDALALHGDDLDLPPRLAQDLAMVVHELATNAAKHGCFSRPDGALDISWKRVGDQLDILWRESGVEAVEVVHETGFGSKLLRMMTHVKVRREGTPDGLLATLVCTGL